MIPSLMTLYQSVAQKGPSVCQQANELVPCANEPARASPGRAIKILVHTAGQELNQDKRRPSVGSLPLILTSFPSEF
jgi:hypothetical protein